MNNKQIVETKTLIGVRVPPGDRWKLIEDSSGVVLDSLTEAIERHFFYTKFKGDFRMSPTEGKLYIVESIEQEPVPAPIRKFNIYGEADQNA
jgi:hypothetical protein